MNHSLQILTSFDDSKNCVVLASWWAFFHWHMFKFKLSPCPVEKKKSIFWSRAVYLPLSADIGGKLGIFNVWNITDALTCQLCSGDKTILKKYKLSNDLLFNLYFFTLKVVCISIYLLTFKRKLWDPRRLLHQKSGNLSSWKKELCSVMYSALFSDPEVWNSMECLWPS